MDKVKLKLEAPKPMPLFYDGIEFEVTPFLGSSEQLFLIYNYVEDYFEQKDTRVIPASPFNYIEAEYNLLNRIIQLTTNIDVSDLDKDFYVDSYFVENIVDSIWNYKDFRKTLANIVDEIKQERQLEKSVGQTVDSLVKQGYDILNKFAEISPESIEKAKEAGLELLEKVEKSSILGNVPKPASKKVRTAL